MADLDLLLVYPDFLEDNKHNKGNLGNYSEGLASISAVLKAHGFRVALYQQTYMPDRAEFIARVKEFNPRVIGFTVRTTARPFVAEMAGWLKAELPDIYVTCGGYHPTLVPLEVLALDGVHNVTIGEGEYPLLDLLTSIRDTGAVRTDIQSMYFKEADGQIIQNPVRPLIEELDELPFPDLDLFDYLNLRTGRIFTAMVMVSRGCLFSCTYCGNSQFRNVYPNKKKYARFRSPENAILLIKRILEKDPRVKYLEFRDAIFNMYEDWFYQFIKLYEQEIHLPFNCNLRFDVLDEKMIKALADAGCYMIDIGLESGNEDMRVKHLHRNMTNEHMVDVCKWLRQYKITTVTYNIVGLPHETLALALETIKLNARLDVNKVIVNIFYPYPMTQLEEIARKGGFLDPSVDPNDPVQLRQPQFTRDDVLYISHVFYKRLAQYRKIFALSPEMAAKKEAKLDKKILSPMKPRWLIWRMYAARRKTIDFAKKTLLKTMPKLYVKLRNNRIEALTQTGV
ncbi:MAG: B12-binding domain-containing radical SAM protein [Oscillospiraceae bacterium]|nr:B12-binding domain-containing radical SAM protein [Oscillospiraceae bacterium]